MIKNATIIISKKIKQMEETLQTLKNKNILRNAHLLKFIYKNMYRQLTREDYQDKQ